MRAILPELIKDETMQLTDKVFIALKEGIISLNIKPRENLVIGDLATFYGISRTPIREALIRLEREGWVEKDGRRGVKVTIPSGENLLDIVETQAALEAYAAGRLAETEVSEHFKIKIMESFSKAELAILDGDFVKARKCADEFSEIMYQELGNDFLYKTVQELAERVTRIRLMQLNQGYAPLFLSQKQHKAIYEAIINQDKETAYSTMFYHTKWYEEEMIKVLKNY